LIESKGPNADEILTNGFDPERASPEKIRLPEKTGQERRRDNLAKRPPPVPIRFLDLVF
jgi:hypothetical protein